MDSKAHIAVSGGFDPIHTGHIDYLEAAAQFGRVIVILNTDEWLVRKKGYAFMDWEERRRILSSIKYVDQVVKAKDDDGTVCQSLKSLLDVKMFGKGGDRNAETTPELTLCKRLDIRTIFGLGGEKTQSSSKLVKNVRLRK